MSTRSIESLLGVIHVKAAKEVDRLADEYRRVKLVPLCEKHRLEYIAGNGRTVFYTEDGRSVGQAFDAEHEGLKFLVPVFAVLDLPVLGNRDDVFGYYIADILRVK